MDGLSRLIERKFWYGNERYGKREIGKHDLGNNGKAEIIWGSCCSRGFSTSNFAVFRPSCTKARTACVVDRGETSLRGCVATRSPISPRLEPNDSGPRMSRVEAVPDDALAVAAQVLSNLGKSTGGGLLQVRSSGGRRRQRRLLWQHRWRTISRLA
jgi:hypothetical protein